MKNQLTLSQAIDGFFLDQASRYLSASTIANYRLALRRLQEFLEGDPPFAKITKAQLAEYMAWLGTIRARPTAKANPEQALSRKTILNHHTALCALWTWAVSEKITRTHLPHEITPPDPADPAIAPLTEQDLRALLAACGRSRSYTRPGKKLCDHGRPTATRDRALILLLLDTGARASEATGLLIKDLDIKNRRLFVAHGKGDKGRFLPFSATTGKAIWTYIQESRADAALTDPLFVTHDGYPFDREALLIMLKRLGEKAGVADCHPHRFRHTFAITFLRNGANAYELQAALGHTTLDMVKRYLTLVDADVQRAHERASPVEGWRLARA